MNKNYGYTYNTEQKYMTSVPKIMFGLMKEIQRSNRLKALELKLTIDPNYAASIQDVDDIMNTDPAGQYGMKRDLSSDPAF